MSISEKINAINNKIELSKSQYDLDRQTANISALSSGDASKYEFSYKLKNEIRQRPYISYQHDEIA